MIQWQWKYTWCLQSFYNLLLNINSVGIKFHFLLNYLPLPVQTIVGKAEVCILRFILSVYREMISGNRSCSSLTDDDFDFPVTAIATIFNSNSHPKTGWNKRDRRENKDSGIPVSVIFKNLLKQVDKLSQVRSTSSAFQLLVWAFIIPNFLWEQESTLLLHREWPLHLFSNWH